MLFFSLLHGKNAATEVGDLGQFLLDFLKSFMPLAVSHLSFCFGVGLTAVLLVQLLELSDFSAKISDLFTKHCEMIHDNRIAHLKQFFKRYQGMVVASLVPFSWDRRPEARRGSASVRGLPEGRYQRRSVAPPENRLRSG